MFTCTIWHVYGVAKKQGYTHTHTCNIYNIEMYPVHWKPLPTGQKVSANTD